MNLEELEKSITADTACVLIQSPNFFGTIEDAAAIAEIAHKKGAMLVVSIAEAVSLGIVEPPRQADVIAMEAQSFGVPLGFGGPYCGVIATREKFVRQMPGRLAGQTTDRNGKRGFVLTLATREQHIRREKATSNICTNQALVALMVNIFMTIYGKVGLKELAKAESGEGGLRCRTIQQACQSPVFLARRVSTNSWCRPAKIPTPSTAACWDTRSSADFRLKKFYPELGNAALWCCTELTTRSAIDTAVGLVAESERSVRSAKKKWMRRRWHDEAHDSQGHPARQPERRLDFREVVVRKSGLEAASARCSRSRYRRASWVRPNEKIWATCPK